MAVVFAYRVAIALAAGVRVLDRVVSGPGAENLTTIPKTLWSRLQDPSESPGDLESALAESTGSMWRVADYSGSFELRKAQVRWGRLSGAAAGTDDAVTTHHFLKLTSGAPNATWVEADFTAIETALAAFWTTMKGYYNANLTYKQVRWYKAGPSIVPPQGPVRIIDPNVAGTGTLTPGLPPQAAVSVTEKTSDAKSWGRFYMPPVNAVNGSGANGRILTATVTAFADAADTMYESFVTAGTPAVVYSSPKASRSTAGGGTLAATSGRALAVTQIQVDDLFDVIRSRRWNEPLLRIQRDIAGA
jgi:hypothetical protein